MKAWRRVLQAAVLWCASASLATGLDPFSAGAAMGIGAVSTALYTGWGRIQCQFKECCQPPWVTNNLTHFEGLTRQHVFGQHLAVQVVTRALRAHLSKKEPRKALVLSFHGWTGGGKNYVARFVAESLFKEGLRSKFVHLFMSTLHFPNEELVDEYKLNLQDWIRGNVSACAQTLFIFDEIDKMPEGVIDAIKPFIDFHPSINGIDFRRSIFIFLSNTGGREITTHTFEYFKEGRTRESLQLKDYEAVITGGAFNEIGGLHKSSLIERSLVDHFVPFLPLERRHVRDCARAEGASRSLTEPMLDAVVSSMTFWPEGLELFSTTGCKRVAQKVDVVYEEGLEREEEEEERERDDSTAEKKSP